MVVVVVCACKDREEVNAVIFHTQTFVYIHVTDVEPMYSKNEILQNTSSSEELLVDVLLVDVVAT